MADNVLGSVFSGADALKRRLYDLITNPTDYAAMMGGRIQEAAQQAQALQNQAFSNPQRPTQVTDPRALQQLTDMIMAGPMGFAPAGITAYHGSPYLFRMFNPAKVGTGEGAQAYGVGSGYTAEARPVAESYKLAGNEGFKIKAAKFAEEKYGSIENAINALQNQIKDPQWGQNVKENAKEVLDGLMQLKAGKTGFLYKGDIPDEILPKFLDWDKPLKYQPEILKSISPQALGLTYTKLPNGNHAFINAEGKPLGMLQKGGTPETFEKNWMENVIRGTGADFYQQLAQSVPSGGGAAKATEALNNAGVRGIRYLDQGSRGEGKGTSNFIPFRPEDFKIQEINDIPIQQYIEQGLL